MAVGLSDFVTCSKSFYIQSGGNKYLSFGGLVTEICLTEIYLCLRLKSVLAVEMVQCLFT